MDTRKPTEPDRYEPLPGLAALPGWVWRKMGRTARRAICVAALALIALGLALAPTIRESNEERAEAERRERAEFRAERDRELRAEQRPRFRRAASVDPAGAARRERLAARADMLDELSATILVDARRRVRAGDISGPVHRVECEPYPRSVDGIGADEDLSRRWGRYACYAVTAEFARNEASVGGIIAHPYRARIDYASGRYALCKVSGKPWGAATLNQTGPARDPGPSTPEACGGT